MEKRQKLEQKVFSYMEKYHMAEPGDKIVLGVSGGADSLCLLFCMLAYQKKVPVTLKVVHVNHQIRKDAGEDADYVEKLCAEFGVDFSLVEENVRELAEREKCSEEDAGRRLRYRAFRKAAMEMGGAKIAVAHNAEDRAETILLHLFRGSGLRGLCGIEPVREDIIRPILCLERQEAEAYLRELGINWRTDSTNLEDDYTRNRIRHHILPYAEQAVSGRIVEHMCSTADMLSETEEYLKQQTKAARAECEQEEGIAVEKFRKLPIVLQKRMLLEILEEQSPTGKDISAVHVEDVRKLFEGEKNRDVCVPFGIVFRRRYGFVLPEKDAKNQEQDLSERAVPKISMEIFPYISTAKIPENPYTKWFDYDKIKDTLAWRFRQTGDYLTIADGKGQMRHKSLKDYMVTEKIPRENRDHIPVLAEGNHVLWLVGYRISEYYKIDETTKRILQVKIEEHV